MMSLFSSRENGLDDKIILLKGKVEDVTLPFQKVPSFYSTKFMQFCIETGFGIWCSW